MFEQRLGNSLDRFPIGLQQALRFVPVFVVEVISRPLESDATRELGQRFLLVVDELL